MVTAETIVVTRIRVYPRPARPGPAWNWNYTVAIPGEPHTFAGDSLSWVRALCKRKRPDLAIAYEWKSLNARSVVKP